MPAAPDREAALEAHGGTPLGYVGSERCAACHSEVAAAWAGSHHDLAMQPAGPDGLLGDFDGVAVQTGDGSVEFVRRDDGSASVRILEASGSLRAEHRVTHAFGVDPLQQMLVELPGGRLQVFEWAWDARPAQQGGQRWFRPYAGLEADAPHWQSALLNWNGMCADCHSTAVRKGYDASTDSYATTFAAVDVGCEACHGPGSAHAEAPVAGPIALAAVPRSWERRDDRGMPLRSPARSPAGELETCARCHSRRTQLAEGSLPPEPLLDAYVPELLDRGLYHADGQILDEVYVYGSFVQSAMHAAGVTCSDCHDPHGLELAAGTGGVCAGCHEPARFAATDHHGHAPGSAGSECVACHMPGRTYMGVDFRRDHSFRVPRPDLSVLVGTPNACNDCHDDRDAAWADAVVARRFPDGRRLDAHYGEAFAAARGWAEGRSTALTGLVADTALPAIVRATAYSLMAEQVDASMHEPILRGLRDAEPLVRLGALRAIEALPPEQRVEAQTLLDDPLRAIRAEAARVLNAARGRLSEPRRRDLDAALAEYADAQRLHGDRAFGRVNRAVVAVEQGDAAAAERLLREAIDVEPESPRAYLYLAELRRGRGEERDALDLLERAVRAAPGDAAAWSALGLAHVRGGRSELALEALRRAAALAPEQPAHAELLGIALSSYGRAGEAQRVLGDAAERFPAHRDVLFAAATVFRDAGMRERAAALSAALVRQFPADAAARALRDELSR